MTKSLKKGEIIQRPDDRILKAFFVKKGLLNSYIIDNKGKKHIFMFAPENWLILDVELFSKNKKAILFIEALEDSEIEIINGDVFENKEIFSKQILSDQIDKLVNRIISLQKRVLFLMSASALERYNDFLDTYPTISQRVPQKMIASYLGVTPETLSTVRAKR